MNSQLSKVEGTWILLRGVVQENGVLFYKTPKDRKILILIEQFIMGLKNFGL